MVIIVNTVEMYVRGIMVNNTEHDEHSLYVDMVNMVICNGDHSCIRKRKIDFICLPQS